MSRTDVSVSDSALGTEPLRFFFGLAVFGPRFGAVVGDHLVHQAHPWRGEVSEAALSPLDRSEALLHLGIGDFDGVGHAHIVPAGSNDSVIQRHTALKTPATSDSAARPNSPAQATTRPDPMIAPRPRGRRCHRLASLLVALLIALPGAAPALAAECAGDECQGPPPAPAEIVPGTAIVEGPQNPPVRFPKSHHKKPHHGEKHRGGRR